MREDRIGRRSTARMVGDYLREGSVLVLVFGLLDLPVDRAPFVIAIAVSLFGLGAVLERIRSS